MPRKPLFMLRAAIVFFILALVAAFFGFSGIAQSSAWLGKVLIFVFVALAILSFVFGRRSAA